MTNILVIGASGFVGNSLTGLLIEKGHTVRAASRSIPRIDIGDNKENYEWKRYDLADGDIDYGSLLKNIDVVVHLAAQVHIMDGLSEDIQDGYRIINSRGTEVLAKEAANRNIKRFIFLSTIKVNGQGNANGMMRATDTPHPLGPYAVSKHEAEQSLRSTCKETGMEYVILRSPLVYGSGVQANFLRLLDIVSRRYPLPFASIHNLRSLIYVENLADILFVCINKQVAANKVYLVKDIDISTPDLIRAIARAFGYQANLFPMPLMLLKCAGSITKRISTIDRLTGSSMVDNSPMREELHWTPPHGLDNALKTTVNWFRKIKKNE